MYYISLIPTFPKVDIKSNNVTMTCGAVLYLHDFEYLYLRYLTFMFFPHFIHIFTIIKDLTNVK